MSGTCSSHRLTLEGLLTVQDTEIFNYCSGGCYQHNLDVMQCIKDVKRDFKFGNKAPLLYVKDAIVKACSDRKGNSMTLTMHTELQRQISPKMILETTEILWQKPLQFTSMNCKSSIGKGK